MASRNMPPLTSSAWSIVGKSQLWHKAQFPPKTTNLSDKVAIITGGNTGTGFESARQFLSIQLSHLIITVRSEEKGKLAALRLREEYPEATIEVWHLDMCSYDSITTFIKRVESQLPRLDIAILNVGVTKSKFDLVPETGHEEVFQVNYLSTILLATLLLPLLNKKSPSGVPGRLSIVSSASIFFSNFQNSQQPPLLKSFDETATGPSAGFQRYVTYKLLCHLFFYKLFDYISADDVVVNLVDPGLTRGTEFFREVPRVLVGFIYPIVMGITRRVQDAASTYLDAGVVKGKESHGCFVMDWEIRPFPGFIYTTHGKDTIERLWNETLNEFDFIDIRSLLDSMRDAEDIWLQE